MNKKVKTVIIDDERRARKALTTLLADHPFIELCGEAENADKGMTLIEQTHPDLIFLDIQMPRKTGFDMLEELETDASIIFVTAFDQYAIRAFEVNAVDYLLKPVLPERLEQTLQRVTGNAPRITPQKLTTEDSIRIDADRKIIFRKVADLLAIQSDGDYTQLLFHDREYLVNQSMTDWEHLLPFERFNRIDRTQIINVDQISELKIRNRNHAILQLENRKTPLEIGRTALKRVRKLLK